MAEGEKPKVNFGEASLILMVMMGLSAILSRFFEHKHVFIIYME